MSKLVLEKAEEPEIKLPISTGSLKKQESSRKISISTLFTMPKCSGATEWGPALVGSRDILRMMALAIERIDKGERQKLDLTGLRGKPIKFMTLSFL